MYTWWQASINVYFYACACWRAQVDVDEELNQYCEAYYGAAAQEVRVLLTTIIDELHDPGLLENHAYGSRDNLRSNAEAESRSRTAGEKMLAQLSTLEANVTDDIIRIRLQRLRVYIESFMLCHTFRTTPDGPEREDAFAHLCDYADAHAGKSIGVCTSSEFIRWRMPKR
jgi:hypothetical protein